MDKVQGRRIPIAARTIGKVLVVNLQISRREGALNTKKLGFFWKLCVLIKYFAYCTLVILLFSSYLTQLLLQLGLFYSFKSIFYVLFIIFRFKYVKHCQIRHRFLLVYWLILLFLYNNKHQQIMLPPINNRNSLANHQINANNFIQLSKLQQLQTHHNTITLTHTHQNMNMHPSRERQNSKVNFFNRESVHMNRIAENNHSREKAQHPAKIKFERCAQNQIFQRNNQTKDANKRTRKNSFRVQITRNVGTRNLEEERPHNNQRTQNNQRYIVHFDAEEGINNFHALREGRSNIENGRKTARLTKQQIQMLPVTSYSGMEVECSICLDKIVIGDEVTYLVCFHFYHAACCKKWMQKSTECPMCKIDVKAHIKANNI